MTVKEAIFVAAFGYASALLILGGYLMSAVRQILDLRGRRYPAWAWIFVSMANALVCGMAAILMFLLSVVAIAPQDANFGIRAGVFMAGMVPGLFFVFLGIHLVAGWVGTKSGQGDGESTLKKST